MCYWKYNRLETPKKFYFLAFSPNFTVHLFTKSSFETVTVLRDYWMRTDAVRRKN